MKLHVLNVTQNIEEEIEVNDFFVTLLIGIGVGTLDILPMIKMKLDKYSIGSAFIHYLICPFIIFNIDLFGMVWWLKGGLVSLLLAIPVIVIVAKDDKKSIIPMTITSVVLGTVIALLGYFIR